MRSEEKTPLVSAEEFFPGYMDRLLVGGPGLDVAHITTGTTPTGDQDTDPPRNVEEKSAIKSLNHQIAKSPNH